MHMLQDKFYHFFFSVMKDFLIYLFILDTSDIYL